MPDLLTAAELAEIEKWYGGCIAKCQGHNLRTCLFCCTVRAVATIRALAEALKDTLLFYFPEDSEPPEQEEPYYGARADHAKALARRVLERDNA